VAKQNMKDRRAMIAGLGAMAAAGTFAARPAEAQGVSSDSFTPTLHSQDEWMSAMKGQHRIVLDVTSPTGVPDAIRFAGNLLTGHKIGRGRARLLPSWGDTVWLHRRHLVEVRQDYRSEDVATSRHQSVQLGRTSATRRSRETWCAIHGVRNGEPGIGRPHCRTGRRCGGRPQRNGREPHSQRAYRAGRRRCGGARTGAPFQLDIGRVNNRIRIPLRRRSRIRDWRGCRTASAR